MSEQNEHQGQVAAQQMGAAAGGGGGGGLFGDDSDDEQNGQNGQQQLLQHQQLQQYQDDLGLDDADADDILGLDDGAGLEGEAPADHEGALLMRFCPHDSSMLYPKVSFSSYVFFYIIYGCT